MAHFMALFTWCNKKCCSFTLSPRLAVAISPWAPEAVPLMYGISSARLLGKVTATFGSQSCTAHLTLLFLLV